MNALSRLLKNLLRVTLVFAILAAILIGLFVAWWIAVCLVLGVSGYMALRRFLRVRPAASARATAFTTKAGAVVVEGEYRVETETNGVQRLNVAADSNSESPERKS